MKSEIVYHGERVCDSEGLETGISRVYSPGSPTESTASFDTDLSSLADCLIHLSTCAP
jgi:hypothetical protein